MTYLFHYSPSPVGNIAVTSDGEAITGLWMEGQKHHIYSVTGTVMEIDDLPVFTACIRWLDAYFAGKQPSVDFPLLPTGSPFQQQVWQQLLAIPYGKTVTYGQIAAAIGCKSSQAVGGAVGKNPISILIPCHRVLGKNGALTGYAGGIEKKQILLSIEKTHPI